MILKKNKIKHDKIFLQGSKTIGHLLKEMEIPSDNHNDYKTEVNDDDDICEVPNNFNAECEVLSDDSDYEEEPVDRLLSIAELMKIRQDAIESYRNCEDESPSEKELIFRIMGWN